jgi:very-short-patch-repair endonuclease
MMIDGTPHKSPRNGEGDHPQGGGGVLSANDPAFKLAKRERRSDNLPEVLLWRELRKRPGGYKFRRQHPISDCVIDFACLERRLAIEVDGEAHSRGHRPGRDEARDSYLGSRGFEVLRIPARDVLSNLEGAITAIVRACDQRLPLHHQPLAGGPPPRSGEVLS